MWCDVIWCDMESCPLMHYYQIWCSYVISLELITKHSFILSERGCRIFLLLPSRRRDSLHSSTPRHRWTTMRGNGTWYVHTCMLVHVVDKSDFNLFDTKCHITDAFIICFVWSLLLLLVFLSFRVVLWCVVQ